MSLVLCVVTLYLKDVPEGCPDTTALPDKIFDEACQVPSSAKVTWV